MGRKSKKFSFSQGRFGGKKYQSKSHEDLVYEDREEEDSNQNTTGGTGGGAGDGSDSGSFVPMGSSPGAYIDHRKHLNLAQYHLLPARERRRRSNQDSGHGNGNVNVSVSGSGLGLHGHGNGNHIPDGSGNVALTNSNLRSLERSSSDISGTNAGVGTGVADAGISGSRSYGSVALDMDEFAREQRLLAGSSNANHQWNDDLPSSINSLEFGGSNPLSDHSSDSTSLDDVCFPDYYDNLDGDDTRNEPQWPDLKYLDEFMREEIEELQEEEAYLRQQAMDQLEHVSFPLFSKMSDEPCLPNEERSFDGDEEDDSSPLLKKPEKRKLKSKITQTTPDIGVSTSILNKKPIDTSPYRPRVSSPVKFPLVTLGKPETKPTRFTYFREDMEKTIHSPNISGLLKRDVAPKRGHHHKGTEQSSRSDLLKDVKNFTLEELFIPEIYTRKEYGNATPKKYSTSSASSVKEASGNLNVPISGNAPTSQPITGDSAEEKVVEVKVTASIPNEAPQHPQVLSPAQVQTPTQTGTTNAPSLAFNLPNKFLSPQQQATYTPLSGSVSGDNYDNTPFWLDVLDPTEEEMKVLSKTFGIHPLTTEDIFLGEAREKVELFKSYYFICFTSFDVVHERRKQRAKEHDKKLSKLQEMYENTDDRFSVFGSNERKSSIWNNFKNMLRGSSSNDHHDKKSSSGHNHGGGRESASSKSKGNKKIREGELSPLNMYMIIYKDAVITFHFSVTPHPVNVRRRARMLKDFLKVSSDWICYALIDDITDSFAPMIESIEVEVNAIEDAILKMHSGDTDSEDEDESESEDEFDGHEKRPKLTHAPNSTPNQDIFFRRKRTKSTVETDGRMIFRGLGRSKPSSQRSSSKSSTSKTSKSSNSFKIIGWKRKGDMLRRIGECRKRVMSILRLLGSKADVIKGFSKRFSETTREGSSKVEIEMYLGDIQDHIVTMVQSLNHYEKLLARFHSNYLAQINIDMTKVNNDTNDALGKITILGTIVLPINIVTGLWGMNCIVPGQEDPGLTWFYSIVGCMILFSIVAYNFARRVTGL